MLHHARSPQSAREPRDVNALVAESLRLALHGPQGKGFEVRVRTEYAPVLESCPIVAVDIGRVLVNIMENALYSMRQKKQASRADYEPELSVRTVDHDDHVEVCIADNGSGIDPAIVARIFDPFFTTKPAGQGTGLGLSTSHEIVTLGHQGTMRVESEFGTYAAFVVTLPKRPANRPSL